MVSDVYAIFSWWLMFFVVGLAGFPLIWTLFNKFTDLGYAFSKSFSLLIISYITFIFGILKIAPFSRFILIFILVIYFVVNIFLLKKYKSKIFNDLRKSARIIVLQEILFILGLVFWSYVRAHQPDIRGLEKFMDFGFINSILRSKYLPPADMWFAGESINYYWYGHFIVAVATKLSGIKSSVTYNLMLATVLGLSLTGVFSIISTLISKLSKAISLRKIAFFALLSAILLNFGGNFHTPVYVLKNGANKYWYPDATRFIGYNPETEDKTIHEFPLYSYVVSDLHAHLINLPFVILYIALLWKLINDFEKRKVSTVQITPLGFVLGIFFMTNAWDFANYSLLTAVLFTIFLLIKKGFNIKVITRVIKIGLPMILIALLTVLPFILNFKSLAEGVKLVHSRTPLWQLAVLWGFPLLLTLGFLTSIGKKIKSIKLTDIFVLSLMATSWILIIMPEVIFVKDIYIASHYRANTMFKLTYQSFVMSYLSSGYIIYRLISSTKGVWFKVLTLLFFAVVIFSLLSYPSFAVNSYYGDLKTYKSLDGVSWVKTQLPDRYESISWLNRNVDGQPVVLEAPGDSYTDFNVVSSYTGLPTISGWFVHEWLWRGDSSFPQKRVSDISQVYTSKDINITKALLNKYKVKYIIVGSQERQKFSNLHEAKFNQVGSVVFSSQTSRIYKIN
jgi:uncharacterized membrane protein